MFSIICKGFVLTFQKMTCLALTKLRLNTPLQGNVWPRKGMLHQGLKVKKLNNFSNFRSVVS